MNKTAQIKNILAKLAEAPFPWVILLTLLLHVLRGPEMILWPQFWAEDGKIFFLDDYTFGWKAVSHPYAGYLHVWPRLLAFVAGYFPLFWIPLIDKLASLFTHFILLSIIAHRRFPGTHAQKVVMMLLTSLLPNGGEVFLNLANSITFCGVILIAICSCAPAERMVSRLFEALFLFIIACSGPFVLFFLPVIVVFYIWNEQAKQAMPLRGIALISAFVVQASVFSFSLRAEPPHWNSSIEAWLVAMRKFSFGIVFGQTPLGNWLQFVLAIGVLAALLLCFWETFARANKKGEWQMPVSLFWLACAAAQHAACLYIARSHPDLLNPYTLTSHYFYPSYLFILWGLVLDVSEPQRAALRKAIVTLSIFFSVIFFHTTSPFVDLHWADQVEDFESTGRTKLKILPPGWGFILDRSLCWRCREAQSF